MRTKDLIMVSMRNLWRRKLRTSLTILGVVIGTTSIVLMISLGIAMNQNFIKEIERMGSLTTINVYPSYRYDPMMENKPSSGSSDEGMITDMTIASFENIAGVAIASPVLELSLKMTADKYVSWIQLRGIKPALLEIQKIKITEGRLLEEQDKLAFLFGSEVAYSFYDPRNSGDGMWYSEESNEERMPPPVDLMTARLKASYDMNFGEKTPPGGTGTKPVRPYNITAIGIIEGQGEHAYSVYTTLDQAKAIKKEQDRYNTSVPGTETTHAGSKKKTEETYNNAIVQVEDIDQVETVIETIKGMGFEAYSLIEYLNSMQNTSNAIQMVLGGIGAISLLVAAIGITNTMIMSIYERTKEIGVMKVIGAKMKDIKKMFLIEASMIGFIGGATGLIISFGGSKILNFVGKNISLFGMGGGGVDAQLSVIPLWLYLLAIVFTTLVGLISGYLPAVRAMKLSVLSALRTE